MSRPATRTPHASHHWLLRYGRRNGPMQPSGARSETGRDAHTQVQHCV